MLFDLKVTGQEKHPNIKRLGNPNGAAALQRDPSKLKLGYKRAIAANQSSALARANDLAPILAELRAEGIVSANAQAKALNERQVLTPRGGRWTARSVINAAERSAS